jgi:hypothetical protein
MKTAVRIEALAVIIAAIAFVFVGLIYGYAKVSPTDPGSTTIYLLIACKIAAALALALEIVALIMRQASLMLLPCLALSLFFMVQIYGQATGKGSITIMGTGGWIILTLVVLAIAWNHKKEETYQGLQAEGG